MKKIIVFSALVAAGFWAPMTALAAWSGSDSPARMGAHFEYRFERLPMQAKLESVGLAWPGNYWPNNKGGIAHRWRSANPQNFDYRSPRLEQILSMDKSKLNELSPAEKYDIFMGRYDYPTVRSVWGQNRSYHKEWYGICHGMAPASLNHAEPSPVTVVNPDGIELTFYTADVKGLLAYFYAKKSDSRVIQIGRRCFINGKIPLLNRTRGCKGVNPASFHVILANKLGIDQTSFIADMDRYAPVWNHAALEYRSEILGHSRNLRGTTYGTVEKVLVKTTVSYAASIDPTDLPVIGTSKAEYDKRTYKYWLYLASNGDIIDGEWVSEERPDFLWTQEKENFDGYWEGVNRLYQTTH